jgi:hypothetical protein
MIRTLALSLLLAIGSSAFAQSSAVVQGVTPTSGAEAGGTRVTILGSNLIPASASCTAGQACTAIVYFGTAAATVVEASPSRIVVTSPAHRPGTAEIRIHVAGVADAVVPNVFKYEWDPTGGTPEQFIRYLVPTTLRNVAGANGSLWTSVLSAYLNVPTGSPIIGRFAGGGTNGTLAGKTVRELQFDAKPGQDGAFFYLPRVLEHQVATEFHIADLSLTADTLGTELPVVFEDEFRSTQNLLAVPVDPRYRVLLRIYDLDNLSLGVNVSIYTPVTRVLLDTIHVNLTGFLTIEEQPVPLNPAYAALDPITEKVRASGESRVRVEVAAEGRNDLPPATTIWALATVTNNTTQQVTAIAPSR